MGMQTAKIPAPHDPPLQQTVSVTLVCRLRGKIIRTASCCVVYDSCAQWYAHRCGQFLQFSGLGCHTGPISLCIDLFVFICVYFCFLLDICYSIVSTEGWTWWDWSLILRTKLPSVFWHCWLVIWPVKAHPWYMTIVFGGMLNLAQLNSTSSAKLTSTGKKVAARTMAENAI